MSEDRFTEEGHQESPSLSSSSAGRLVDLCTMGVTLAGGGATAPGDHVHTITDNKTGQTYEGRGSSDETARQDAMSKLSGK